MSLDTIITAITEILNSSPHSVEILPGSVEQWQTGSTPFLFVDSNLGIPQKLLYQLYPHALKLFKNLRLSASPSSYTSLLEASSIILLTNPAHQTALHERKRLALSGHWSVEQELDFTALLLASGRDASKQSIVWDHRRYLLQTGFSTLPGSDLKPIPPEILRKELDLILRSCESYPRNYYGWSHWDLCMEILHTYSMAKDEYYPVIIEAFTWLLQWIEQHLSDYSAVHHICRLVHRFHGMDRLRDVRNLSFTGISEQAVSLVSKYPDHEALWMYLRIVWTIGDDRLRDSLEASITHLPDCKYRERCVSWCKQSG
ncbi:hypothetical protein BDP27DRAFT_1260127 [Rhodocollybia butyracea]|uniref:Protein prenyltransferase alpha subunit n=1 Tax=Rhodocollybia butyracea TaxID=206335 RepID=A0A9P5UCW4_9AGAR|nr:hypothetical protein BDP27DRAFT_1260127 [Rhodocollybia butyracea]